MIKKIIFIFIFFIIPNFAWASINVEARRASIVKEGTFGDFQIQGNFQRGNTNLVNLGVSGLVGYQHNRYIIFGFGNISFTSEDLFARREESIQSVEMAHLRQDFAISSWLHWELFTQVESNQNMLIDVRYLIGTGPRFEAYKNENFFVVFGASYMPEYEALSNAVIAPYPSDLQTRKTWVHRWNNYFGFRVQLIEQLIFHTTTYIQPRFDRFSDIKIANDNVLILEANKHLDLILAIGSYYDHEPPVGCDITDCTGLSKLDINTQLGIKAKF